MIFDYYPGRPETMEGLSLHDVVSKFDVVTFNPRKATREMLNMQIKGDLDPPRHFRERGKAYVIKMKRFPTKTTEDKERYMCVMLLTFVPWRERTDVLFGCSTYAEAFAKCDDILKQRIDQHKSVKFTSFVH